MSQPQLAQSIEDPIAYYYAGRLIIGATVIVSASNYRAEILRSPILIFPPSNIFLAYQTQSSEIGEDVLVPRKVTASFVEAVKPNVITLRALHSNSTIEVIDVPGLLPSVEAKSAMLDGGGGEVPSPHLFDNRATGYSSASLEDAFNDAVTKLPVRARSSPDELTTVSIIESGAQYGGFAGFSRFFVTVSAISR